jgi:hypothetical protein
MPSTSGYARRDDTALDFAAAALVTAGVTRFVAPV